MPTVAEQLREAREARNLSVYQIADVTKIRTDHIRALDDGNYDVFSAPVYIRGFVRAYANVLKLDVPQVLEQLKQELSRSDKHHEHPPLSPRSRGALDFVMYQLSRVNWRVALPALALAFVLLLGSWTYRIWNSQAAKDPLSGIGPGLYQPPHQQADTLPLPKP